MFHKQICYLATAKLHIRLMMTPTEATQAFQKGELKGFPLMFAFAKYPNWQIAIEDPNSDMPEMKVFTDDNGHRFVNIYESSDRYSAYTQTDEGANQTADYFLETNGYAVFLNLPKELSYINLNPGTPDTLNYQQQQLGGLVQAGSAAYIDEHVEQMNRGKGNIREQLHAIKTYNFDVVLVNGGRSFAGAPDKQGRQLVALFTYPEARQVYLDWYNQQPNGDSPQVTTMTGDYFCKLMGEKAFDGVVLNCAGPVGMQAFSQKVVALVNGLE